jgi:hypothetical protein
MSKQKQVTADLSEVRTTGPLPPASQWYIQPIGGYTSTALFGFLEGVEGFSVKCYDGEPRPMLPVSREQVENAEQSRETDKMLHFDVWFKNSQTGEIRRWRADESYIKRNPSLFHQRGRKLKSSLKTGDGKPVNVPRKRKPQGPFGKPRSVSGDS